MFLKCLEVQFSNLLHKLTERDMSSGEGMVMIDFEIDDSILMERGYPQLLESSPFR